MKFTEQEAAGLNPVERYYRLKTALADRKAILKKKYRGNPANYRDSVGELIVEMTMAWKDGFLILSGFENVYWRTRHGI
ncbi:hypothetical protein ACP3V3_03025 [Vibrio sp. PNB22_3_1]